MGAFARAVQRPIGTFCIVTTAMLLVIVLNYLNTIAMRQAAMAGLSVSAGDTSMIGSLIVEQDLVAPIARVAIHKPPTPALSSSPPKSDDDETDVVSSQQQQQQQQKSHNQPPPVVSPPLLPNLDRQKQQQQQHQQQQQQLQQQQQQQLQQQQQQQKKIQQQEDNEAGNDEEEPATTGADPFNHVYDQNDTTPIPKIIHQIWWQSPFQTDVSPKYSPWMNTWLVRNPGYKHKLWNGTRGDEFIRRTFDDRIYTAWRKLPLMVQRTDFLRYGLLWAIGGVFTDMDTECIKPIDEWGLDKIQNARVFVGKEWNSLPFNPLEELHKMSIGSWTLLAPPRHPLFGLALTRLVEKIEAASNETLFDVKEVVPFGGPNFFTHGVLSEYLGGLENDVGHPNNRDDTVKNGVMVFEVTRFNPTGPGALGVESGRALVLHHFTSFHAGGWRSEKPDVQFAEQRRRRRRSWVLGQSVL